MKVVEYHIQILWDLSPPSITNTIEDKLWEDAAKILVAVQILRVICTDHTINM